MSGREVHSQFRLWLSSLATRGGAGVSVLSPRAHLPQPNGLASAICSTTSALHQNSMTFGGQASYRSSVARCGRDDVHGADAKHARPSEDTALTSAL